MITEQAGREILWNVGGLPSVVTMYSLLAIALAIGFVGVFRRVELWRSGKEDSTYLGSPLERFFSLFYWGALQHGVTKERFQAVAHSLIYIGFLALLFTTTMVFIDHDLGIRIYQGNFYLLVTIISDLLGAGVLVGCALASHRRYIKQTDGLHSRSADRWMLTALVLLIIQGFAIEGLRIHVTSDPWALFSPVGLLVSKLFWPLSAHSASWIHFVFWWFHTVTVFALVALLPYTKFFHLISSVVNLYFRSSSRPKGAMKHPGDLEKMMESGEEFSIGLRNIKDYSWKQIMDLDACTSCGRCQDNCPAYLSGKPLSPKWLILDTRNHALLLHSKGEITESLLPSYAEKIDQFLTKFFLKSSGIEITDGNASYGNGGSFRGENTAVHNTPVNLGGAALDRIAGEVLSPDVFWSCTTCRACVEVCPVGINHLDQILENRRNMVLMEGEIPSEAQMTLRGLESRGNPYGPAEERTKWSDGLEVPIIKEGDTVDIIYWVGCVSSFDPRKQKIARSLVKIMKSAGLTFGILGSESCTGDPARRLGEENLFQTIAKGNISLLNSVNCKTIVTNCPHCLNTLKNEYPDFGLKLEKIEVIHHSVLIDRLISDGKIIIKSNDNSKKYTYHDPCYLGRYNGEYDAPRRVANSVPGLKILEMERSREKGMCCGAGGGHFWMDIKKGDRINLLRTEQAASTGADVVITGCPFCLQMMEDGVKLANKEEGLKVQDLAELVAQGID